jgi:hypothetical protein
VVKQRPIPLADAEPFSNFPWQCAGDRLDKFRDVYRNRYFFGRGLVKVFKFFFEINFHCGKKPLNAR